MGLETLWTAVKLILLPVCMILYLLYQLLFYVSGGVSNSPQLYFKTNDFLLGKLLHPLSSLLLSKLESGTAIFFSLHSSRHFHHHHGHDQTPVLVIF